VIFVLTGSVALLADLIHNVGDALTAVPLGVAFALRSERAEGYAGLAVVLAIFISALLPLSVTHRVRRGAEARMASAPRRSASATRGCSGETGGFRSRACRSRAATRR
jgi:Co/Zn/Cd efflux system component